MEKEQEERDAEWEEYEAQRWGEASATEEELENEEMEEQARTESEHDDEPIEKGEMAEIKSISGVKLIVARIS